MCEQVFKSFWVILRHVDGVGSTFHETTLETLLEEGELFNEGFMDDERFRTANYDLEDIMEFSAPESAWLLS
jgi:hypothetical protein